MSLMSRYISWAPWNTPSTNKCQPPAGVAPSKRLLWHPTIPSRGRFVMHGRRQFLRNSLLGTSALLFARSSPFSFAADAPADSRIDILLGESLGTISPDIYGHFVENLSGVVYDGIWVGENSKVPNI